MCQCELTAFIAFIIIPIDKIINNLLAIIAKYVIIVSGD